ncbi:Serine/threonine-protein kinase PknB [Aquisphaera giovannonii]|uniref:Serine/threonine-protein kinase PknB n=1 Tax=Aquisphaera giovannonii TaxID=406548 RepID=A0A5B9W3B5_9BACT|nr:protein kinase [Aquisphaera giovannonii]QEH34555.1 Serine/threonine-protein kinase PknB [Aquisphaera giovannonii]
MAEKTPRRRWSIHPRVGSPGGYASAPDDDLSQAFEVDPPAPAAQLTPPVVTSPDECLLEASLHADFRVSSGSGADSSPGGRPAAPSRRMPGLPGYELLSELGRGGMGVVYKAREVRLNRLVAVKMILAGHYSGADSVARLLAEAETVARLDHPNVVQIYAIGDHEGRPFVALEYVGGGSLGSILGGTPWPAGRSAELTETLARAIQAAHDRAIVHRDLKPANILMTPEGIPKISDFGLAKTLDGPSDLTAAESIVGSPSYMAPEQADGRAREAGPAADVYSLGAILYELLTGRPPFRGASVLETLEMVKGSDPVPPSRLVPGLPRDVETICLKCLQKEPSRRYATAGELADDLGRYRRDEPIRARPAGAWERAWKWTRRKPAMAALALVSVVAVAAAAAGGLAYREEIRGRAEAARHRAQRLRGRAESHLALGRAARDRGDWPAARAQLSSALALVQSEPSLAELLPPAQRLFDEAGERIAEAGDREAAQARGRALRRLHDEAVFYQSQYTGLDPDANLESVRRAARQALAQLWPQGPPYLPSALDSWRVGDDERARLLAEAYEVLLLLAEALGQPASGEGPAEQARLGLAALDQAARLRTPTRAYHALRAASLERLGLRDAARVEHRLARDSGAPASAQDEFLLGEQSYRRGDFLPAVDHFKKVLSMDPGHFWAGYLMALCFLKTHRPAEAQAALIACQARRPDFVWIYLLKGFAEGEMREFELAEADFRRAQEIRGGDDARYVLLVNRGVMRLRKKEAAAAIEDLQAAIALKPGGYQAYLDLAQAQARIGRADQALATLDRAIRATPDGAVLYRVRGQIEGQLGRDDDAMADFDRAIRHTPPDDPQLAEPLLERGRVAHRRRRPEAALADFDRALAIRPDLATAQRLRGAVLMELRRYDEAVRSFDACLARGGPTASLYEARGLAQTWRGRYDEALADFSLAARAGGRTASLCVNRGWAHLFSGEPRLAEADFDEAIRLDAGHADARCGRGLARAQLRRGGEAIADARAVLDSGPADPRLIYNAVRIYCLVAADIQSTPARISDREFRMMKRCRDEALAWMLKAMGLIPAGERGRFWRDVVSRDPTLDAIRSRPAFRELQGRYAPRDGEAPPAGGGGPPP